MAEIKYVLLAEDDEEIRELIADKLRAEASDFLLDITEAKDGAEATMHAARREFDCVITDLKMPRASGEDLIRGMLKDSTNADTPMLVVSGHLDDTFTDQFQNVRSFRKPFDPDELAKAAIREIKLGRINDRIAVHLMNAFIDGARQILEVETGAKIEIGAPQIKKSGDNLHGDHHCTMMITTGPAHARLTLSFDNRCLNYLKQSYFSSRSANWSALSMEATARQTCFVVFDKAKPKFVPLMGGEPRLAGITVASLNSGMQAPTDLVKAAGIQVHFELPEGKMVAGAYGKPRGG